jgi:hypothetical protein
MKQLPTGEPVWDLKFDEKGGMDPRDRQTILDEIDADNLADLYIFSHHHLTTMTSRTRAKPRYC